MNAIRGRLRDVRNDAANQLTIDVDDDLVVVSFRDSALERFSTTLPRLIPGVTVVIHNVEIDGRTVYPQSDSLLVVEPDVIVDVTEVAECFVSETPTPDALPFLRSPRKSVTEAMVIGTLINAAVDTLVMQPSMDDEEVLRFAVHQRPVQTALVATDTTVWNRITTAVAAALPAVRHGLQTLHGRHLIAEPTFISPLLGLQGRIDFLVRSPDSPNVIDIIELKSGSAPSPSPSTPQPIRPSHRVQAAAYDMMLRTSNPQRQGQTLVWYPRSNDIPFRTVVPSPTLERAIVETRNALVLQQMAGAKRLPKYMEMFNRRTVYSLPDYMRNDATDVAVALEQLTPIERMYFRAWSSFLHNETLNTFVGEGGIAELWTTSLNDKRSSDRCLTDLVIDPINSNLDALHLRLLRASTQPTDTSLRAGDPVILFRQQDVGPESIAAAPLLKATIRDVSVDVVEISLRNKLADRSEFTSQTSPWIIQREASVAGLKALTHSLALWAMSPSPWRQTLLGLREPRRDNPPVLAQHGLYPRQLEVVRQALASRDWFLIQGPPGTGKTSAVLREIVLQLHATPHERLLLLAYTNRAADEICHVIERALGSDAYLRIASKDGADRHHAQRHLTTIATQLEPVALSQYLSTTRCVVATVASMNMNLAVLDSIKPSTVIIDEASQVLEPNVISIVARAQRLIMIGDECQLPAVIGQDSSGLDVKHDALDSICLDNLGQSYFDRLMRCAIRNNWNHAIGRLTEQGRMHQAIGRVVGRLFYGGTLTETQAWQRDHTPWRNGSNDALLQQLYSHRLVFINTGHTGGQETVLLDAAISAHIATMIAHDLGINDAHRIGIISPFRNQNFRIRSLLSPDVRTTITVDTVERFQGSERDVMIIAASVASPTDLDGITSLANSVHGPVDRKLNVAISRARQCCIIVGNRSVLTTSPSWASVIDACHVIDATEVSHERQPSASPYFST